MRTITWLGVRMSRMTEAAAPDPIEYLDVAAGTAAGAGYKQRFVEALAVRPGHTVLDIGCGPGTDLGRLADAVGPHGSVLGIDRDPGMVTEARRRLTQHATVSLQVGDAHRLPMADARADRARVDRVLQHVADPAAVLTDVRRVLRPGGIFGMAEPDWDTLAVADDDVRTSREFARFVAGGVRNATIGRELVRLCTRAGFRIGRVEPVAVVFRDFGTADRILGLRRHSIRAVTAGRLPEAAAAAWLSRLIAGPVLAGFTLYLVTAHV
jgi:ubiquinone/menaquinone biosynthesis C-methylase UbiE